MTRIFLVGLMGAGKTTIGTQLASVLGCPYLDNDALLEEWTGETAVDLAQVSSASLHERESEQLRLLVTRPGPFVAGVAASLADRPGDLALTGAAGIVIYLRASPATLSARITGSHPRPWVGNDPEAFLERAFAVRDRAFQSAASVLIESDEMNPAAIVRRILRFLAGRPDVTTR
jgi:shikimate kinase